MSRATESRAEHLLRWYPEVWRSRYGEEFAELLIAEIEEAPRSWRRTADVATSGIVARLSVAGLTNGPVTEPNTALAMTGGLVAGFAAMATSLWSQLVAGSSTQGGATAMSTGSLAVVTISLGYLAILAAIAGVPVVVSLARSARRSRHSRIGGPTATVAASIAELVAGGIHVAHHWPGSSSNGYIPGSVASFGWAETFSINTFWVHPTALSLMQPARLGWMWLSPVALMTALVAAATSVRRVELSPAVVRFEARLAKAAAIGMLPLLLAAASWVLTSQHDANAALRAGTLDLVLIAAMSAATLATATAARRLAIAPR